MIKIFNFKFSIFNKKTAGLLLSLILFVGLVSQASAWTIGEAIVPCTSNCTKCELLHLGDNIIDFIMIGASPVLATLFFIWAGVLMMLGGANPGMLSQGKKIFKDTFIGLLIVMMSWLFTNILITTLLKPTISVPGSSFSFNSADWWKLTCQQIGWQ
ncbi:MAG: hypothetical protein A3B10_00495 [Candidatus Doudnabacteria bacterium RIFCSPLOWO2_01_FULL_44_21]|uniref:Uncharacterized protein n=1 Tax=Candidatus Doudnabacteria bacterium RIFCSPLOWO2_01_FULL_44_21 TaxID=1817841 RepID=A0A1F5PXF7_9BACT|nr:MAG: hypothetical protein A3B10_00495 [Candidatus Doudnabacteria bacterium RIFCSPLOWO2_01_FULL_44_21]